MTDSEKLTKLQTMVPDETDAAILSTFLELAGDEILVRLYPYGYDYTDVPARYEELQLKIAAYHINKMGAEGQISHSENGIVRQYESADTPASYLNRVTPFVGVIR